MDQLHKEKWSAEVALEYSKAALTQAIKNLESANYALRAQEDRRNAGSIMLSKGVQELNEALNAIRAAEHEQQAFQSQVTEWSAKVYGYQEEIQTTQNEMEKTNEALKRIGVEIKEVHKHLEDTGNIQNMVRRSVFFLNILSGRVTALERQTQHSISWQPVVKVIEEVMKAIVNIAENRLLYSDGAPGLINTLRENVGGLLALCNSPSNSEDDSYY
ncbi:hypothetical protein ROHU_005726 [Labeo rohita]|uniref:Uncharacterized protein n=1 Tax=Labeo rohita TaxID=84645 RepID=A0A498MZQ5_LABRO|nr:hypothetical protein ROHU_005726 [Labeo rohita]